MDKPLRVVQVNSRDYTGEETVRGVWGLHQAYRRSGIETWMAVGRKFSIDPNVFVVPNYECRPGYAKALLDVSCRIQLLNHRFRGMWRLGEMIKRIVEPWPYWQISQGVEEFYYPGTRKLLELYKERPNIVHCHDLWGYFDLRTLPWFSRKLPVLLTLHDSWLLAGHCRDSLDCGRWKTGCGQCPYLDIPCPITRNTRIKKDSTSYNWRQKKKILAASKLYLASPSRWLMGRVKQSHLADAIAEARVIPYGVDLSLFHPTDKQAARQNLKIQPSVKVILSTTIPAQENPWQDYRTIRAALEELSDKLPELEILVIAVLGPGPFEREIGPSERIGKIEIRFLFYPRNPRLAAGYYQAADIYLHAAPAAVFPLAILEALACGLPVVATATGGIPEQIEDGLNGFLVPGGDISAMASSLRRLLTDQALSRRMGRQAAETAASRFSLQRQANDYLNWYEELRGRGSAGDRV